MRRQLVIGVAAVIAGVGLAGWSSPDGSSAANPVSSMGVSSLLGSMSIFKRLGGMPTIASLASAFVHSSLKDPLLAGLTAGRSVDPATTSGKVSSQLCALLGGGCQAPLTHSQVAAAAGKVSAPQAAAIEQHFKSSLEGVVSNPAIRAAVMNAVGSKLPGVLSGVL